MRRFHVFGIWAILFALLVVGHFALSPVTDFSADDWHYLAKSAQPTPSAIVKVGVHDIYRPVNLIANMLFFHAAGDQPLPYSLWGILAHGILLALLLALIKRLGGDDLMLWLGGLVYVINPNIYESFHWACHEVLLYVPIVLATSMLLWIDWCQRGGGWKVALALPLYCLGVFSYEYAVPWVLLFPLCAVMVSHSRRVKWASIPFIVLAGFYLVWRFSSAFGWGAPLLTGGEYFGGAPSLIGALQNIRGVCSWWIGGRMAQSILGGFSLFFTLLPKWQFVFILPALFLILITFLQMRRTEHQGGEIPAASSLWRMIFIGLMWAALAYAPHIIFPASARHNLFPSLGLAIAFAAAVRLCRIRVVSAPFVLLVLFCLIANAGNTMAFREAGKFSRNLYTHILKTAPEWEGMDGVVFDTETLRARQTKGILGPISSSPTTWASYQNANLLRGFTCSSMLKLAAPQSKTQALLDMEYGVRREGQQVIWHERYNPAAPHETPLEDLYWVDCLSAGQQP